MENPLKLEPGAPPLPSAEVHLWVARTDRGIDEIAQMRAVLSSDEQGRAASFIFDRDRNRFIAARAILRGLLASYLAAAPASIGLRYNQWGKPRLARRFARSGLRFNLSHSNDLAVYAFATATEVGVDVEEIRPGFAAEGIAEQFFSRAEVLALRSLPRELQAEGFFNCWTRKEAYIKALGGGLSIGLSNFDVSLRPRERAAILRAPGSEQCRLASFQLERDYVAAVAVGCPNDPVVKLRRI
jgi:4'-phosphopantetheinyl transferase